MPRLWNDTIKAHRQEVRTAIQETAARLAAEQGPLAMTMSAIAEATGIGRATLYKYFPDVETILVAWHQSRIAAHLDHLVAVRDAVHGPGKRLAAVLTAYAQLDRQRRGHRSAEFAAFLRRDELVRRAQNRLRGMIAELVAEGAASGDFRHDIAPAELADYCLSALSGAGRLASPAAVVRLVEVTLAGLRPPPDGAGRKA